MAGKRGGNLKNQKIGGVSKNGTKPAPARSTLGLSTMVSQRGRGNGVVKGREKRLQKKKLNSDPAKIGTTAYLFGPNRPATSS